jgi:TP53 regulating kinase-like protein
MKVILFQLKRDIFQNNKNYVIKQIQHEPCDYYSFGDKLEAELKSYKTRKNINLTIPILIDVDKEKECIVKEYIDGSILIDLIANNNIEEKHISPITEELEDRVNTWISLYK